MAQDKQKRPGILSELRRRHVFRIAGIYIAGAWVVIEVASVLFDELATRPQGSQACVNRPSTVVRLEENAKQAPGHSSAKAKHAQYHADCGHDH